MPKEVVEKVSFNEFKIEKVNLFTQSPTKIFCINVFNAGGCLDPYKKKRINFSHKKLVLITANAIFPFKICCNFSYKILI